MSGPSSPNGGTHRRRGTVTVPARWESLSLPSTRFANVREKDDNGQTALHVAAGKGNSAVVQMLLENGAERESRDHKKQVPLHLAAGNGDLDTVSELLGPGTNTADKNGINAIDKYWQTPLHVAARYGNHLVAQLLVSGGAEKEARAMGYRTPLHVAASHGKSKVVRVLLRRGANKAAKDNNDQTPLHLACENGDRDTVRELLRSSASVSSWINWVKQNVPFADSTQPSHHRSLRQTTGSMSGNLPLIICGFQVSTTPT